MRSSNCFQNFAVVFALSKLAVQCERLREHEPLWGRKQSTGELGRVSRLAPTFRHTPLVLDLRFDSGRIPCKRKSFMKDPPLQLLQYILERKIP